MWKLICTVSALVFVLAAYAADKPTYPTAAKRPVELEEFENVRVDNYFWLNQRDNPEVIEYLEAENRYADAALAKSSGLQQRLIEEMKSRIKQDESSAPYRHGDYLYYERYEPGKEYPIYCDIELEYDIPAWSNSVKEVKTCLKYARQILLCM